ncbi:hypothetical protein [Pseudomonas amygdali]|nr:hypothetical protein [Pseudomonas amygdali]KPC17654.1 Uncharacterized protein AC499_0856 [Pseudomonas amygdali pv. lachrymans]RMT06037.1 hypothetical protein ALP54_102793 [Pseudomonas amygdali pv. lachrymans]
MIWFAGDPHGRFERIMNEGVRYAHSLRDSGYEGYSVGFRSIIDLAGAVIFKAAQTAHESFKG